MVTVRDLVKVLRVSERTIYRMMEHREIPFYRIRARLRFDVREVKAALAKASRRANDVHDEALSLFNRADERRAR